MALTAPFADIAKDTTLGLINAKTPALGQAAKTGSVPVVIASNQDTLPVSGDVGVTGTVAVTGPLTDTQLRSTALPVSAAALPLPTGAATQATLANIDAEIQLIEGYFKAEDAPAISGDKGLPLLAMRQLADTTTTDNDGDYTLLKIDEEGRLKVSSKPASYPDITGDITAVQATINTPVAGGTVSGDVSRASNIMAFCTGTFAGINVTFEGSLEATGDGNWFGLQAVRSNANTIETATGALSAQPVYGWEMSVNALKRVRVRCTARTSGTQAWRFVQGTYATEPIPAAQATATQGISGSVISTPIAPTASIVNSVATTNGTVVKASAGTIYALVVSNTNAAARFLKLHNSATVTAGTTAVALTIPIPAASVVSLDFGATGMRFGTGICLSITGAAADGDTTAIGAGEVKVNTAFI